MGFFLRTHETRLKYVIMPTYKGSVMNTFGINNYH